MKFILCADLHLKESEKNYSLSVLQEIIDICIEKKCEALLFAGDVFDNWSEVKLRADFRTVLEKLPVNCKVYYLPGNHEELRSASSGKLETYDFGSRVQLLYERPFSLLEDFSKEAELLAIPFQKNYSEYRNWNVPEKKKSLRFLLAHGIVTGVTYTGPNEVKEGVFDEDLFSFLQIDLALMGHIHTPIKTKKGNVSVIYPGSARVCREGETGLRSVILFDTETRQITNLPLETAGEYKVLSVFASPGGELSPHYSKIRLQSNDWIKLDVNGIVEDENIVVKNLTLYTEELKKKCRKVTEERENLSVVTGIMTHPLAISFLDAWQKKAADYEKEDAGVYETARLQGLIAIKNIMEKRK